MKALVFGTFFLGLASLGFSQDSNGSMRTVELEGVTLTTNAMYLATVNDINTPTVVKELQLKAAKFDPVSAQDFDPKSKKPYEAIFKSTNGRLIAAYGPSGKIVSSQAKFSNVTLPLSIRKQAFADVGGWKMKGNQFVSTYIGDEQIRKRYKIFLENGNQSKKLIFDLH